MRARTTDEARRRYGDERLVSQITGIPVRTLQKHRLLGKGLPFYRLAGRVLYDLAEVDAVIRASAGGAA